MRQPYESHLRVPSHIGWIESLVESTLALPSHSSATNFYLSESDSSNCFHTTAEERLRSLRTHLHGVGSGNLVLVGEAAGWRGARQSGIAFTSAPALGLPGTVEASAAVVHGALDQAGLASSTLLWNALPTHPHKVGAPMTNRTPTNREIAMAANALSIAIDNRLIVCVGQKAANAVSEVLDCEVRGVSAITPSTRAVAIRHPSFGGAPQFRKEFAACLTHWNLNGISF